jgi:hypothetical protein
MIKFLTKENGKAYIYTKFDNSNCQYKPVFGGKAAKMSTVEFEYKYNTAKSNNEIIEEYSSKSGSKWVYTSEV